MLLAAHDDRDAQCDASIELLGGDDPLATLDLAYYEVANTTVRAWRDPPAATVLREMVDALVRVGRLIRVDSALAARAAAIADREGISVYDAAYVAAAERTGARLVSCDVRDLVSRGLAITPAQAVAEASPAPSDPPPASRSAPAP